MYVLFKKINYWLNLWNKHWTNCWEKERLVHKVDRLDINKYIGNLKINVWNSKDCGVALRTVSRLKIKIDLGISDFIRHLLHHQ